MRDPFGGWISPDNRFVFSLMNGKVVVWQVDGDKPKVVARRDGVSYAEFAPDRAEIIIGTPERDLVIQPLDGKTKAITVRTPEGAKDLRTSQEHYHFQPGPYNPRPRRRPTGAPIQVEISRPG